MSLLGPLDRPALAPYTSGTLERAAGAMARLDRALQSHPLLPAYLYRARLEAVRRLAEVDGRSIDPWHLAAVLEGLRLRLDHAQRIIDRGAIFDAARHALDQHQWLTLPDRDQAAEIQRAVAAIAAPTDGGSILLAAARSAHAWLDAGGNRPPLRAALVRHWTRTKLLQAPVPLTGPQAFRADTPWALDAWIPAFLEALGDEADGELQRLLDLERAWFAARGRVAGRRSTSRAARAVDIMAAAPLVSATTLAAGLDMAIKNAAALLDEFRAAGIAVEVTHRSKRRLFGLAHLAPLRDGVAPPRRPEPGRGRGRPRNLVERDVPSAPPLPERPLTPIERKAIDYSDLERWMANADQMMRDTRRTLEAARDAFGVSPPLDTSDGI